MRTAAKIALNEKKDVIGRIEEHKLCYYSKTHNKYFYDNVMFRDILDVDKSQLQKLMKKYTFEKDDYIEYKNMYLYSENAIKKFINFIYKL